MQQLFRKAALARRAGRLPEAIAAYRTWIAAEPANPFPRYALSVILLSLGRYDEGWELYEARATAPETGVVKPRLSFPEWDGSPISSLLIWREQGLGDEIMFARYAARLAARGLAVSILCSPPLARLFGPLGVSVIPASGEVRIDRHDAWCLAGSLPRLMGGIAGPPYLPGGDAGVGVGIMTRGNPRHPNDAQRSLPDEVASQLAALGRSLAPEDTGARDFQETAEIIAGLALVITVDTSVAHLAGAMGKPTWLLVGQDPDWRWGLAGECTPWYASMRLFRQETPGDWRGTLERVRGQLAQLGAAASGP